MVHRLTVSAVLCVVGCGGTSSPPQPVQNAAPAEPVVAPAPAATSRTELAMDAVNELLTRMCSCVDRACADAVHADMSLWAQDQVKGYDPKRDKAKATEDEMQRMTEIGIKYGDCMTKAMTASP